MFEFGDPQFFARWLAIVVLDLTLAGDNALVIALAVRNLPPRQQLQGRLWGTLGAVALRIAFIGIITTLLAVPLLQALGSLLLIWIAVKLLIQENNEQDGKAGGTLPQAVWIIVAADVVMSLDNVLAVAAAARGDFQLVVFGVGLSVPIVVWGSGLLARLMRRFPWIVDLGSGILGYVAGEMLLKDPIVHDLLGPTVASALHRPAPFALGVLIVTLGRFILWRRHSGGRVAPEKE